MALVEKYHVVAALYAVDRTSPNNDIVEGQWVFLNGANGVRRVDATANAVLQALGVAGDTKSASMSGMPGVTGQWQSRASDYFDETKASAKITVYHSGGEFATDQFVDTNMDATKLGHYLKLNTAGVLVYDAATPTFGQSVAQLTRASGAYPSGVPGTDVGLNGDIALGGQLAGTVTNKYIEFKMLI
jgi:hypothetical protein